MDAGMRYDEKQVLLTEMDRADAFRDRFMEIGPEPVQTQKPFSLMPDYLDAEQALEILPFLEAFAHGRPVWEWRYDGGYRRRGRWERVTVLPLRTLVRFLSLEYKEDNDGAERQSRAGGTP